MTDNPNELVQEVATFPTSLARITEERAAPQYGIKEGPVRSYKFVGFTTAGQIHVVVTDPVEAPEGAVEPFSEMQPGEHFHVTISRVVKRHE